MQTDTLRYFLATYGFRSFPKAAKSIPMTTRGLIKAMRSLEDEIGAKLFIVGGTGELVPTKEADRFAVYAKDALAGLDRMLDDFAVQASSDYRETLRVGLPNGMADVLGRLFWEGFEREHPDVQCVLEEVPDRVVDDRLLAGCYDVALTVTPFCDRFETIPLETFELGLWVNKENPIYERGRADFEDLRENVLFTAGRGYKNFEHILEECRRRDIEPLRIVTSGQLFRIFQAVKQNLGAGTTPRSAADHPLFQDPEVGYVPFGDMAYTTGISWMPDRPVTEGAHALIEHVKVQRDNTHGNYARSQ